MAFATNFDKHMKAELEERLPEYKWEMGWHLEGEGGKVDLVGLKKNQPQVFVEVELKRDDPAANVIKVWRWALDQNRARPVLFVQGFSKRYWQSKTRFRERAEFVGARMVESGVRVKYEPTTVMTTNKRGAKIPFRPRTPAKEGAGRLRLAAITFARQVARLVRANGSAK